MQSIVFCNRCRGMKVGWTGRYVLHCLTCVEWLSRSSKLLILTVILAVLILGYSMPGVYPGANTVEPAQLLSVAASVPAGT